MKNHVKSIIEALAVCVMALVMSILADPMYQPVIGDNNGDRDPEITTEYGTTLNNNTSLCAGVTKVSFDNMNAEIQLAADTVRKETVAVASANIEESNDIIEEDSVLTEPVVEYVPTDEYLYAIDSLYIRSGPGTEYTDYGLANTNDIIHVTGRKDGCEWVRIDYNGIEAYVHSGYLSTEKKPETYLGNFKLTAYCACMQCCGKTNGITASGTQATAGRTVAMYGLPFGTKLKIGDHIYVVEDRGTQYGHVDIYFNTHEEAVQFGLRYEDVYIVE